MSAREQSMIPLPAKSSSAPIDPTRAARSLRSFHDRLFAAYGPQRWWPAKTPLEVIVGAYLTQNTSWRAVERSIANLAAHRVFDFESLRAIGEDDLRQLIRPSGYMVRKAAAIKAFVAFLDREYSGSLDALAAQPAARVRGQLLALFGVGEETADAILVYALGHPAIVVDEYLRRIAARHALAPPGEKYAALQKLGSDAFAHDPPAMKLALFNEFHALVVAVGKQHCGSRARCEGCPLAGFAAG
jgi:endonuclease III related protein